MSIFKHQRGSAAFARRALLASALVSASFPSLAYAQDATPVADDGADNGTIREIIVTANKRSESIDKVPLAIAAVSGDILQQQGVASVQDLSRIVPGLTATTSTFGTDIYTIRGVGFYDSTLAAVPAVSVYVDQAPLPYSVLSPVASLDPERVEVLMGPQGTLFGENSTGGAINYIAAKPTSDLVGGLMATVGNYETYNVSGYVSGPVSSTLGARLSFRSLNSDKGWQRSISRNDRLGEVDQQQMRLLLDWKPTDRVTFLLNLSGFNDKSDMPAPRYVGLFLNTPSRAAQVPQLTSAMPISGKAERADWDPNTIYRKDNKLRQVSLRADVEISDALTLTNIATYNHYEHDQNQDGDGLAFTNINHRVVGKIKNFSDELRVSGDLANGVKFVFGGNYRSATVSQHDFGDIDVYSVSFVPPLLGFTRWRKFEDISDQSIKSYAVFGNVDYDVNAQIAMHAGARYTYGKSRLASCTSGDAGLIGLAGAPGQPGSCITRLTVTPATYGLVRTTDSEDNVSWRLGLDYKPVAGVLLYANVSRGFKAGGYPVLNASAAPQLAYVRQEQLTSYEVGFKANLFNRKLRVSGAAYHYDYKDKQIRGREVVPVFGGLSKLINIPNSKVDGGELNAQWYPLPGLTFTGGFSYVDSKIKNFSNVSVRNVTVDLSEAPFPNAPKFSSNLSGLYDVPVNGSVNVFVGGDFSHVSRTRGTIGFDPELNIPAYDLLGAQAGVHADDDKWRLSVWAKNLTNKYYIVGSSRFGEGLVAYAGMPRTYGATFAVNFR